MKLKLDTFEVRTRSQTLPDYTNEAEILALIGSELLREEMLPEKSTAYKEGDDTRFDAHHPHQERKQSGSRRPTDVLTLRLMGVSMCCDHLIAIGMKGSRFILQNVRSNSLLCLSSLH